MRPFIAIAMLLTVSAPIGAHHGSASFDTSRVVSLDGTADIGTAPLPSPGQP